MAIKAYILIDVIPTNVKETMQNLKQVKGVKFADAVTGPYDAVAQIEASDINELGKIITDKIVKIKGVSKTLTCVAV